MNAINSNDQQAPTNARLTYGHHRISSRGKFQIVWPRLSEQRRVGRVQPIVGTYKLSKFRYGQPCRRVSLLVFSNERIRVRDTSCACVPAHAARSIIQQFSTWHLRQIWRALASSNVVNPCSPRSSFSPCFRAIMRPPRLADPCGRDCAPPNLFYTSVILTAQKHASHSRYRVKGRKLVLAVGEIMW